MTTATPIDTWTSSGTRPRTGERGDGVVFVSAVEDAVRIRNGERGDRAL